MQRGAAKRIRVRKRIRAVCTGTRRRICSWQSMSTIAVQWLRGRYGLVSEQFNERYEIKWLGTKDKHDPDSTEVSKHYVGVRTEADLTTKIMTQN